MSVYLFTPETVGAYWRPTDHQHIVVPIAGGRSIPGHYFTGYLAELLQAYCGDGSRWGLRLRYAHEKKPRNTAGALALIDGLEENSLVVNGDVLTTLDYHRLWEYHLKTGRWLPSASVDGPSKLILG